MPHLNNNNRQSSTMFSRRHLALLAVLALSTLSATASAKPTSALTEEPLALLTRPAAATGAQNDINYHGIVLSFPEKHSHLHGYGGINRLEKTSEDNDSVEAQRERNNHSRIRINVDQYPPKDQIPDVNHPQVQAWIKEIDWTKVPNIPVAPGLPDAPRFPQCPPKAEVNPEHCWWSCDECLQPTDVVSCPSAGNWGLTYDDGPSVASKELVKHLDANDMSATFFIVGSRVLEYPDILKAEVASGHHIAMHTWSHAGMTTLTNAQIVAEVRWSEKIIRDVTGLTMKYIRPPYGDCDNRVREILRQMGYTNVIWTQGWDTNDWRLPLNQIKSPEIISTFKNALRDVRLVRSSQTGALGGPISLEHDLTKETVDLSKTIIEMGRKGGLKPMNLAQCLSDPNPYQVSDKSSIPLNKDGAVNQAPKPDNNNDNKGSNPNNAIGGGKEATTGSSSQDSSSTSKSAAASLQSIGVVALAGISAIASYFLTL